MQPYFVPYLGYWQLINAVDKFVLLDDVSFIKQGFINRNSILSNGKAQQINIQIDAISSNKLILEHEINKNFKWKRKILVSIKQNYSKARFFSKVFPIIEDFILYEEYNLSKYLAYHIAIIASYLNIKAKIIETSGRYVKDNLKAQQRIIAICKEESSNTYINTIGGLKLYDKSYFKKRGIELKFIKMDNLHYEQNSSEFVPSLSIIDALMFNSVEDIQIMLNRYVLE